MEITNRSEMHIVREEVELESSIDLEYFDDVDTFTRIEVDGETDKWIPHDAYGMMPESYSVSGEMKETLEQRYKNLQ